MNIDELIIQLKEAKEYFGTGQVEVFVKGSKIVESIGSVETYQSMDGECEFYITT